MKFTLLGTGGSAMVPVYGCQCRACLAATQDTSKRREKSSAYIEHKGHTLLLDANAPDLMQRFPAGSIDTILLTHYHMDHVHSLFDLRWGVGAKIPVISPDDPKGCDDLYKHSGILDFSLRAKSFQPFDWHGILITPLPLNHSKLCLGYCFEYEGKRLAYLTDTNGLPKQTEEWLSQRSIEWMITDCSYPPIDDFTRRQQQNHNDFYQILAIDEVCCPKRMGLTHISHSMDCWAQQNPHQFNDRLMLLRDRQEIIL